PVWVGMVEPRCDGSLGSSLAARWLHGPPGAARRLHDSAGAGKGRASSDRYSSVLKRESSDGTDQDVIRIGNDREDHTQAAPRGCRPGDERQPRTSARAPWSLMSRDHVLDFLGRDQT